MVEIRCVNKDLDIEKLVYGLTSAITENELDLSDISKDPEMASLLYNAKILANKINEAITLMGTDASDELLFNFECLLCAGIAYSGAACIYAASVMSCDEEGTEDNDGA